MALNFNDLLERGASGAALGSSIAPGIGTAVGAGLGILDSVTGLGLFGDSEEEDAKKRKKKAEDLAFQSRNEAGITGAAHRLMGQKLGAKQASHTRSVLTGQANQAMEQYRSTPGASSNPNVIAGLSTKLNQGIGDQITSANIAGASRDSSDMAQGAQMLFGVDSANRAEHSRTQELADRPSGFETLLRTGVSMGLGQLMAGPGDTPDGGTGEGTGTFETSVGAQGMGDTSAPPSLFQKQSYSQFPELNDDEGNPFLFPYRKPKGMHQSFIQ